MMRYAVIDSNNIVVNTIIYTGEDGPWSPPDGCIMIASDSADVGDIYNPNGSVFSKPVS
jgi:hypothetical protein